MDHPNDLFSDHAMPRRIGVGPPDSARSAGFAADATTIGISIARFRGATGSPPTHTFFLIGTTSRSVAIRHQALHIGSERARHWVGRWHRIRRRLNADTVVDELGASYAAAAMGIEQPDIRRELAAVIARYSPRELLYCLTVRRALRVADVIP